MLHLENFICIGKVSREKREFSYNAASSPHGHERRAEPVGNWRTSHLTVDLR